MSTTLILGASDKPYRYAYLAKNRLLEKGHQVILVNPRLSQIDGICCLQSLDMVKQEVDTVTIYVQPSILEKELDAIVNLKPKRIIFNPGSESLSAADYFRNHGIEVVEACTLVMLTLETY